MTEAATVCGLSLSTIGRAIKAGELQCFRRGRNILIDRDSLLKWSAPNTEPLRLSA
ncbi:helix-turn-helix domain-containing protein [Coraliomargarita sp. W4R53]